MTALLRAICIPYVPALLAIVLGSSCVSREVHQRALADLDDQEQVLEDLEGYQRDLDEENKRFRSDVARLTAEGVEKDVMVAEASIQRERLREELEKIAALRGALSEGTVSSPGISSPDVEVFPREGGGMGVRIGGSLLFALGKTDLTEEGRQVLRSLADQVRAESNLRVQVIGHTDDTRIVRPETKAAYPYGNLQLSAVRAVVVAKFLESEGNIPRDRIGISAFGSRQPLVANSSVDNRARNRRVEIHFMTM